MQHSRIPPPVLSLLLLLPSPFLAGPGAAQTPTESKEVQSPQSRQAAGASRIAILEKLAQSLAEREADLQRARTRADAATDGAEKATAQAAVAALDEQIEKLRSDFAAYATGVESEAYQQGPESTKQFDLLDELVLVVKPLVQELKQATEEPRLIAQQRATFEQLEHQREVAQRALNNLNDIDSSVLNDRIETLRDAWRRQLTDATNRVIIARDQLDTRLANRKSLLESMRSGLSSFFRSRGLHLLMALAAFLAVFLGLRLISRPLRSVMRRRPGDGPPALSSRIFAVVFHSMVGLLATSAALLVFYAAGDWGLLGLSLLLLLGLAWASKEAIPRYFLQMQLLLNIGPVREGERVVQDGIPWRVDRINMYTYLINPALSSGRIRMRITDLIDMRSRPVHSDETWFPSQVGDWVVLDDGKRGRVLEQTPEMVRIEHIGGAQSTYQTSAYLGQNPMNISGQFGVTVTFGVDYQHQAICTTVIPEKMQQAVRAALDELLPPEQVLGVQVPFKEAGASSLDYLVIVELDGAAAPRSLGIRRTIQRCLVDACNANGWVIPFTQLTVHQAAG